MQERFRGEGMSATSVQGWHRNGRPFPKGRLLPWGKWEEPREWEEPRD